MFELDEAKEDVITSDEPCSVEIVKHSITGSCVIGGDSSVEVVKNSLTIREDENKDSSSSSNGDDSKDSNKK